MTECSDHAVPGAGPRPRTVDALTAATIALLVADQIVVSQTTRSWAVLPAAIAALAALLIARRHLVTAAWVGACGSWSISFVAAFAGSNSTARVAGWELVPMTDRLTRTTVPSLGEIFALCALAGLLVWSRRPATTVGPLVALSLALVAIGLLRFEGVPVMVLVLTVPFAIGLALGVWMRLVDEQQRSVTAAARQEERLSLARDLHDVMAHHLTGIALHAQAAQLHLADEPEVTRRSLDEIDESVRAALRSVRSVVGGLRTEGPAAIAPTGSAAAIAALGAARGSSGPAVEVHVDPGIDGFPETVVASLHRIAQESIANAHRHARAASTVSVRVTVDDGGAAIEVVDDGRATEHPSRSGFGLVGIEERVHQLGGTVSYGPGEDGGWRLVARISRPTGPRR